VHEYGRQGAPLGCDDRAPTAPARCDRAVASGRLPKAAAWDTPEYDRNSATRSRPFAVLPCNAAAVVLRREVRATGFVPVGSAFDRGGAALRGRQASARPRARSPGPTPWG
jgi:hypothetical protein